MKFLIVLTLLVAISFAQQPPLREGSDFRGLLRQQRQQQQQQQQQQQLPAEQPVLGEQVKPVENRDIERTLVSFLMHMPVEQVLGIATNRSITTDQLLDTDEQEEQQMLVDVLLYAVKELLSPPAFLDQTLLPLSLIKPDFTPTQSQDMTCLFVQVPVPHSKVMFWAADTPITGEQQQQPTPAPALNPIAPAESQPTPGAAAVAPREPVPAAIAPREAVPAAIHPLESPILSSGCVAPITGEAMQAGVVNTQPTLPNNQDASIEQTPPVQLKSVEQAFVNFDNVGIATADARGFVRLPVRTPQPFYMKLTNTAYLVVPPHVSYRYNNDVINGEPTNYVWSEVQTAIIAQTQRC